MPSITLTNTRYLCPQARRRIQGEICTRSVVTRDLPTKAQPHLCSKAHRLCRREAPADPQSPTQAAKSRLCGQFSHRHCAT
ncbi:hypothetical protein MRX96_059256 [Rhipicephalus microplus]